MHMNACKSLVAVARHHLAAEFSKLVFLVCAAMDADSNQVGIP